jgi:drug/metabolite transporter (DMT)-like permease
MHATYKTKNKIWSCEDSAYYYKDGRFNYGNLMLVILRSILGIVSITIYYLLIVYSKNSGVNASVFSTLFAGSSFLTALAFYIVYTEKLENKHIVGMLVLVLSVLLMSMDDSKN